MRSPALRTLFGQVRTVLLDIWNPIGVDVPPDEYDAYVWPIVAMLKRGTAFAALHEHLSKIEDIQMDVSGDEIRTAATARALLALEAGQS